MSFIYKDCLNLTESKKVYAAIKASDVMIAVEGNRKAFIEFAKKTWWLVFDLAHTSRVRLAGPALAAFKLEAARQNVSSPIDRALGCRREFLQYRVIRIAMLPRNIER